ncbi:thiamine phosphate synthase [Streptomyces sp. RerS4]|uniref:thiamine phosphate synthase n=1 Tax=Streptomyces sp. RerS4 TaxID=2942449 RepID=UPI00201BEFAB|nr:thiamine phosphate synthase [Streptomyces sp. RerS4]UQX03456.1 thiamine phosphate synthase [Streptomyces sp. RerS4]
MDTRQRLSEATLYLCTDARRDSGDLADFADAALTGGVDVIQLRDKGSAGERKYGPLEAGEALEALAVLRAACRRHGALLAVNDRADLARAAGADVLHLGQGDLPLSRAREIVGGGTAIGRSTHDTAQLAVALADPDLDYFAVGPCWQTPTKPGRPVAGLDLVRAAAATGDPRPWFAIGGIGPGRLPAVLDAGARGIAVVRALTAADDARSAAAHLTSVITAHTAGRPQRQN